MLASSSKDLTMDSTKVGLTMASESQIVMILPLAAMIKGTEIEDLPAFVSYFKKQLDKLGVQLRLNTEVTPSLIDQVQPDVILIATGATLTNPEIPGIE
jgi:hypothetical protein